MIASTTGWRRRQIEKLLARGAAWLSAPPDASAPAPATYGIAATWSTRRCSAWPRRRAPEGEEDEAREDAPSLNAQRLTAVATAAEGAPVRTVLDLGCGEGALLGQLLDDPSFTEIVGMDVLVAGWRWRSAACVGSRCPRAEARLTLRQGSLLYRDAALAGYDGAAVVEVIEHLDPPRLEAFARVLLGCAQPRVVVLTTPNAEYNARYRSLPAGDVRHRDHRFEWARHQFADWAARVAAQYNYRVAFASVGEDDPVVGAPTQMAIFERADEGRPTMTFPKLSLVVLVGPCGCGKCTFARRHFLPTEMICLRRCRARSSRRRDQPGATREPSRCCTSSPGSGSPAGD